MLAVFLYTVLLAVSSGRENPVGRPAFIWSCLYLGWWHALETETAFPSATPGFQLSFLLTPRFRGISYGPWALKADPIGLAVKHQNSLLSFGSCPKPVEEGEESLFFSMKIHYYNSSLPLPAPHFVLFTGIRSFFFVVFFSLRLSESQHLAIAMGKCWLFES